MSLPVFGEPFQYLLHPRKLILITSAHLSELLAKPSEFSGRVSHLPQQVNVEGAAHHDDQDKDRHDQMAQCVELSLQLVHVGLGGRFSVKGVHIRDYLVAGLLVAAGADLPGFKRRDSRIGSISGFFLLYSKVSLTSALITLRLLIMTLASCWSEFLWRTL